MNNQAQHHVEKSTPNLPTFRGRRRRGRSEPHFRHRLAAMRTLRLIRRNRLAAIHTLPHAHCLLNACHAVFCPSRGPSPCFCLASSESRPASTTLASTCAYQPTPDVPVTFGLRRLCNSPKPIAPGNLAGPQRSACSPGLANLFVESADRGDGFRLRGRNVGLR